MWKGVRQGGAAGDAVRERMRVREELSWCGRAGRPEVGRGVGEGVCGTVWRI